MIKIFREIIVVPDKKEYVLNKHKYQKDCIFCKALKGEETEVKILYRNEKVLIALNKFPYNSGHLLIIPTRHVENIT
ncbi:MAG: HIT family protein, partial [Candidatus Odinarchaeia archaeon]